MLRPACNREEEDMALLENGLLKGSATMALWGLGVYVGLAVAVPLLTGVAKPLVKEAERGYQSLRSRLKKAARGEAGAEQSEAEIEIAGQGATVFTPTEASVAAMEAAAVVAPAAVSAAAMEAAAPASSAPAAKSAKRQRKPVARGGKAPAGLSKAALYDRAKELKIAGRSAMSKEQLIAAVQAALAAPKTA
ncbi:MAG: hypothetical protein C4531_14500 [Desulfurivibrio sp.]|nr:MAG: hypothetical protein C4531_14500 [Desulfurivibrio sp.]